MVKERLMKDKDNIVNLYLDGLTHKQIAKIYNTSDSSIARLLRGAGITSKVIVTENDEQAMVLLYQNGMTVRDIAKQFNIGKKRASDILKKHNIVVLKSCERPSKYTLNENYFDCIDTQDKAYLLGLLYADGCNYNGHISLRLQERDKDILDKMNRALSSDRPLRFIDYSSKNSNHQNQYALDIINHHMSEQLVLLGMVQNKSLVLKFPEWLQSDLYSHFIRGYFDGDGYVSKNYYNAKLSIVSTEVFCKKVQKVLKEIVGINSSIYLCHNNELTTTRTLQISGRNQIRKFLDYLYHDANLYLQRKYDVYESLYKINGNINNALTA